MAKEGDLSLFPSFFALRRLGRLLGQSEARGHVDSRRSELCCCGAFLFFLFQVFFFFLFSSLFLFILFPTPQQTTDCQEIAMTACHGLRLIYGTNNSDSSMTGCGFCLIKGWSDHTHWQVKSQSHWSRTYKVSTYVFVLFLPFLLGSRNCSKMTIFFFLLYLSWIAHDERFGPSIPGWSATCQYISSENSSIAFLLSSYHTHTMGLLLTRSEFRYFVYLYPRHV